MHVIHFSAECYPVAKVGGLADVLGALPKYQQKEGVQSEVVMPYYERAFTQSHSFTTIHEDHFFQGERLCLYRVLRLDADLLGFPLYLVKIPGLLDRPEVYGYADESEQFLAFQHAALDWLCKKQIRPDIIHCHDHHTGLIPFYVDHVSKFSFLRQTVTIGTLHNAQYQGWMSWDMAALMPEFDSWSWGLLDWDGQINPLAALVKCVWNYTTVSVGYLRELFIAANGLESLLVAERLKSTGIINGVDNEVWDPKSDPALIKNYTLKTVGGGKQVNKSSLCERFNLDPDLPLFSFIGRFALEKGADMLVPVIQRLSSMYDGQFNFLVLGSGDPYMTEALQRLSETNNQHFALYLGYNEELAHQIYAGSDFLVMPSRVEPCGLNQFYAMRYGTIPVVQATGGLKDTVWDIAMPHGYGIVFEGATVEATVEGLERALKLSKLKQEMTELRKQIMGLDFSWDRSALKYIELYKKIIQ